MKYELPPFRMIVSSGKLTPADPYSAERLDSYRNGSELFFQPVTDPQSKLRKKYWAILRRVIDDCPSPWNTSAEASQALKLALGIVDQGLTVSGATVRYPKSLNDLTEPEFESFYEGAMHLLYRITGVDPETLSKESRGSGKEAESSVGTPPHPATDEGSGDKPPRPVTAATPDQEVPVASAAQQIADKPGGSNPPPGHLDGLKAEAIDKILQYATDPNLKPETLLDNMLSVQTGWLVHLPNNSGFIKTCCATAARVIRGEITVDEARKYLRSL